MAGDVLNDLPESPSITKSPGTEGIGRRWATPPKMTSSALV